MHLSVTTRSHDPWREWMNIPEHFIYNVLPKLLHEHLSSIRVFSQQTHWLVLEGKVEVERKLNEWIINFIVLFYILFFVGPHVVYTFIIILLSVWDLKEEMRSCKWPAAARWRREGGDLWEHNGYNHIEPQGGAARSTTKKAIWINSSIR